MKGHAALAVLLAGVAISLVQPTLTTGRDLRLQAVTALVDEEHSFLGDPGPSIVAARPWRLDHPAPLYAQDLSVGSSFIYPPIAAAPYLPLAFKSPAAARATLSLVSRTVFLLCAALLIRLFFAGRRVQPREAAGSAAAAIAFLPLCTTLGLACKSKEQGESALVRPLPMQESVPVVSSADAAPKAPSCPSGMAALPGGSFVMGTTKEPARVEPFCLDLTEVTVAAFTRCVEAGRCIRPDPEDAKLHNRCNWKSKEDRSEHPINCIDYHQARQYCTSVDKRLPTEAEFEWAARGGDKATRFPWGDDSPISRACFDAKHTCVVGAYPKGDNPWGVHDLAGNVWEWTDTRIPAMTAERAIRGGAWSGHIQVHLEAAFREPFGEEGRKDHLGARCVKSL